ncbi:acetyl-CoA carboxylase biotin carboxyl carrier protein [Parasphingopyxis marina]|uniref:Biotin carboxyl carrier protein of acetyl-CoA carboxylase n=1 Tax=Parasphingopyxis marina TaxID=2761622 RepID=A0A842I1J9_9SPHN|nr:biotin/lipoyl-containing protein [Parasphingopyxis marina]MBC2778631.1 acetyl-CoA carboxylase biotin carboxyl carrier protein subunit [Parasphingopyxis marina]
MKGDLPLTPDDVNAIVAILDGGQYDRLDIRTGRFRLRVARSEDGPDGEKGGWTQQWSLEDDEPVAAEAEAAASEESEIPEGMTAIRATLPGTFYRAPSPGADAFVEVGDMVEPDTPVGIIETMKLFNPAAAGCSGEIAEICVDNAEMIAAGRVLMLVK